MVVGVNGVGKQQPLGNCQQLKKNRYNVVLEQILSVQQQ
jgi:signal recognition particle GTPase